MPLVCKCHDVFSLVLRLFCFASFFVSMISLKPRPFFQSSFDIICTRSDSHTMCFFFFVFFFPFSFFPYLEMSLPIDPGLTRWRMAVLNKCVGATAELGGNPVSKHQIQPEYGDEQADAGRDCRTRLARPNFQTRMRTGKYSFFLFS